MRSLGPLSTSRSRLAAGRSRCLYVLGLAVALALAGSAGAGAQFQPTAIELVGTVRDFSISHPDMQYRIAFDPGIVEPVLGPDGKPVYTTSRAFTATTHGRDLFDQWYRDVAGVNLSAPLPLTLTNSAANPDIFTFDSSSFFPIDGQLGGNAGMAHNYYFTFELHTRFTYRGGEVFQFRGDDDVFVFVNDRLVIDLGGVHGPLSKSVSLDAVASQIGIAVGGTYDLDFFFAERFCCGSNFRMQTSILLEQPPETGGGATLEYEGDLTGDFDDPAALAARLLDDALDPPAPIPDSIVAFTLGDRSCRAPTDAEGRAACFLTPELPAGDHELTATFAGDVGHPAAERIETFAVTLEETALALVSPVVQAAPGATLRAVLREDGALPLGGRTVTFSAGGPPVEAVTDGDGIAAAELDLPAGTHSIEVAFAGDERHEPAGTSGGLQVLPPQLLLTPSAQAAEAGSEVVVTARLLDLGAPRDGLPVRFEVASGPNAGAAGSCPAGACATGPGGEVAFTYSGSPAAGEDAVTAFVDLDGDGLQGAAEPGAVAAVLWRAPDPTALRYAGPAAGDFHDPVELAAVLEEISGAPVAGARLRFALAGEACSATTGAGGRASCFVTPQAPAGAAEVTVAFDGSLDHLPAAAAGTFSVTPEETVLTLDAPPALAAGETAVSARLAEDGAVPLAGRAVTFTAGDLVVDAATDAAGVATALLDLPLGVHSVEAAFAGDPFYEPAAAEAPSLVVFEPGQFVIWGGNTPTLGEALTLGGVYPFWGARWESQVTAGDYAAQADFKGYAATLFPGAAAWETRPGASSAPPATVPEYMSVIVATSIEQRGSTLAGDVAAVGIVRVIDPAGYRPDPGHDTSGELLVLLPAGGPDALPRIPPGPPEGVQVAAGAGFANVSWSPPADPGSSLITGYSVVVSPGDISLAAPAGARSRVIPGLTPGIPFSFEVVAHNAAGAGPASTPAGPVVPLDVPGAPAGVTTEAGDGALTVRWQPPAGDGGSSVTAYTVTASPGGATVTVGGTDTGATLGGLRNGVAYAVVVRALNAVGSGPPSSPPATGVPLAPAGPPAGVVAAPGDGRATVYWTAPADDGGAGVAAYTVTAEPGGASATVVGDRASAVVEGLANGTAHTFIVRAAGPAGIGASSALSPQVIPFGPPPAPGLGGAEAGNASARVTWNAPGDDGGRPVTGYLVTEGPGEPEYPAPAGELERVLTGLANGMARSFTVTAVNDAGPGEASAASAAVVPSTVPGPPVEVTATAEADGTLSVAWQAPEDDGGASVESYRVEAHDADPDTADGVLAALDTGGSGAAAALGGLEPGSEVVVTVRAVNARGAGPQSAPTEPVTASVPPGPPTDVLATASAPATATVTWLAPADDGGTDIVAYTVTSDPEGLAATVDGETTSAVVPGLTLGTAYTFTVVAENAVAAGPPSAPSNALVGATVPDPPTAVAAVGGDRQATVSWAPPAFDGFSPVSSYTVTAAPGGAAATVSGGTTSAVVSGLINGATYTFAVRATNTVGTGEPSAPSNPVTPATVPGAPTAVTAAVAGDRAAEVSWAAPADDGGSPVTGYTLVSSPGGLTVSTGPSARSATVTGLTAGTTYTFTVFATNAVGDGPSSAPSNPVLAATVPGLPTVVTAVDGDGEATVSWTAPADEGGSPVTSYTVVSSPGGRTVTVDGGAASAVVTGLGNGTTYTFTVFATNAIGDGPPSTPSNPVTPATVPGAPAAVVAAVGGNAAARVSWAPPAADGGAPVIAYTVVSSPGGLTATVAADTFQATVDGLVLGESYTFTVTATNRRGDGPPSAPSNAVLAVAVPDPPTDVTAAAGDASATVTWTAPADQGGGPVLSYQVVSEPGAVEVVVAAPETTVATPGLENGTTYTFTVTATNAVGDSPPSEPSNPVTPQPAGVVALSALAVDPGRVVSGGTAAGTVTLTGPAETGGVVVSLASDDPSVASVPAEVAMPEGATTAAFTVTTGAVAAPTGVTISATLDATTLSVVLTVDPLPAGDPPAAEIAAPADDASVTAPTEVLGTATAGAFDRYVLEVAPAGETAFTEIGGGTAPVANGLLGTLDPTLLLNDLYTLRLTVFDTAGRTASSEVTVQVEGAMKVGNFTLSFVDLSIPVAGLPVTVVRTYDSRDRSRGDFGVGWRLDVKTLRIRDNGLQGTGWRVASSGGGFPTFTLLPNRAHKVSLRLPTGRIEEFDLTPTPSSQALVPLRFLTPVYTPRPGTVGSLRLAQETTLQVIGDQPGQVELLDLDTVDVFDPRTYVYTSAGGDQWLIDEMDGVTQVTDTNGNRLTIGPGGITHSSGVGVTFARDGLGRITSITDPEGAVQAYAYDATGDLVAHTDAEGAQTTFGYDADHFLTDIADPLGRPLARNEYDADGRVVATTDAAGNRVEFEHDLAANREVVRDRLGNLQTFVYDEDGNLTSQTDQLANTTTSTYDAEGNLLTETDPLGNTRSMTYDADGNLLSETDAEGNTRSTTYNALGLPLTETDARLNTTVHTYDGSGNRLTSTDAEGNTTTKTYDAAGNLLTETDALGFTTTRTFDAAGRELSVTDAEGNTTSKTYDAKGNLLTESRTRTVGGTAVTETARVAYDAEGRVTSRTNRTGAVVRTEYDATGQIAAQVDARGNRTELSYDFEGNLVEIRYPDGTTSTFEYDAEGRKTASTDRAGRRTRFVHDAAGQLLSTIHPAGAVESVAYDAAGRTISQTDANGNTTTFEYDAAGRRTAVTDPLGNVTRFAFDAEGNKVSETDANGNTTTFEYDALGRMTRKVFPDGTDVTLTYDAEGNKVSETDQAGRTTAFEYDGLGRLVQVTDALGGVTTYGFDEAGNRTSVTDARGNTTASEYDAEGRETRRILPLGQELVQEYDAAGNLVRTVDAEGDEILLEYDASKRLVRRTLPGSAVEETVYTPTGRIASRTDRRGTTTYTYDTRDRLIRRDDPDGSSVAYTYDAAGNRLSVTTPSGTTTHTYDGLNRLLSTTGPDGGTTAYAYDAVGNLAEVTYHNGTSARYTYDALNRLTRLENLRLDGTLIRSYEYTLGLAGNRLQVAESSGRTVSYAYDALYRLTREAISGPGGATTIDYTYDAVGNRLTRSVDGVPTSYTYDANDRLLTEGSTLYSYDADGNLLTRTEGGVTTAYEYDGLHRLVRATDPVQVAEMTYDPDGHRVTRAVNGVETRFLVDTEREHAQVLEERTAAGGLIVSYVHGLDLESQTRGGAVSYYHYDGLGSVRALTDALGSVTDTYDFEAFGELLASTGSTANDYLFAGEQLDPNLGFYYLRARYYDPAVGRFPTADTYPPNLFDPETLHRYAYAVDDPVNRIDPSGRFATAAGLMNAVTINNILSQMQPTLVQGAIVYGAVKIFFEPGFELRNLGLHLMERALDEEMWEAAMEVHENGLQIIRLGSHFTKTYNDALKDVNAVKGLGFGIAKFANAFINRARFSSTGFSFGGTTPLGGFGRWAGLTEVRGINLFMEINNGPSTTLIHGFADKSRDWTELIRTGHGLLNAAYKFCRRILNSCG